MNLVSFSRSSHHVRTGAVVEGEIVDLTAAGLPDDMTELIRLGHDGLRAARDVIGRSERFPLDSVRLHAPVRRPPKNVICVGRNYRDHAAEFSRSGFDASERSMLPERPIIFTKAASSIVGPDEAIVVGREAILVSFVDELCSTSTVSDETFASARELLGTTGVVELVLTIGYYAMLGHAMSACGAC